MFDPKPGETIELNSRTFTFVEHSGAVALHMPQATEGGLSIVYKVIDQNNGNEFGLKVYKSRFRSRRILEQAEKLSKYSSLPGLLASSQKVITHDTSPKTIKLFPELEYAILMPWIEGKTWFDVIYSKTILTQQTSRLIAQNFAWILCNLEQHGLAHCSLAGSNVIINFDAILKIKTPQIVSLIGLSHFFGPDFPEPISYPIGSDGYRHRENSSRARGQWHLSGDRFSAAVLLAEMLTYHDDRIKYLKYSETYFSNDDMQKENNNRYRLIIQVLREQGDLQAVDLFAKAWLSQTLEECPTICEWVHGLEQPLSIPRELAQNIIKLPMREAKCLVIGQGSVGKTSLVQQILHSTFNQNQPKTEGISINQWQVNGSREAGTGNRGKSEVTMSDSTPDSPIKLNIWDFGGQEIMHATHQFFLTKRSLYLLALDARLTQEENRVEYWLKIIQSFGGESPVLIVGNKIDQHPLDIDRTGLQKKYPNIVGILETSAATGAGIEALKAEIAKQVDTLPHVRDLLPETWFTVKSKLEELGRDKNFITQDEYLNLCGANDVTDETSQHTLIGFLHDLGVVLHFQDDPRLEALGILNPQWVTNGVYKILNSHELFQNQGTLTLPILNKTLNPPEYPSNKRLFIVDMMKKFELCYDIESDKSFLIPDLLPKDEPFTGEWDEALAFQYHYNVLPTSIISRFIVRMNAFVHKTVWRSGVVLKNGGNTALVKADTEDRKISIWVNGDENTRRDFLSAIRMEFDTIHKSIVKIEAMQKVPHPDYPELVLDYDELMEFERQGVTEFPKKVGSQIVKCNVRELLDGIRPSKIQTTKVFISYGHEDKTFVKKLAGELTKANIETWWDFDALRGGHDWQKEIQRGIKLCDYFVVVLSPSSVERDWVLKEITFANEYKKKIIPLKLQECERPISIIEKQYIDFENQTQKAALKELLGIVKSNS